MWLTIHKTLVWSFYRQHAGFFLFLFIVFFGIVAPSQQLAYHYALIRGMIEAPAFLAVVAIAWLLYAGKVVQFVFRVLDSPEGLFVSKLRCVPRARCYWMLLRVQHRLFLPVSGYALAVIGAAVCLGAWMTAFAVVVDVGLICAVSALLYYRHLERPGTRRMRGLGRGMRGLRRGMRGLGAIGMRERWRVPYWSVLMRFLVTDSGWLLAGIKVLSCTLLYLLLRLGVAEAGDLRAVYFFWCVALFGHGILLFRCRGMEAERLAFYRALPVPVGRRLLQYGLLCGLMLVPETIVLGWLTPGAVRFIDAVELVVTGYSLLFLVTCCLMVISLRVSGFLKLWLVLFGIWYGCVLGGFLIVMSVSFVAAGAIIYCSGWTGRSFWYA